MSFVVSCRTNFCFLQLHFESPLPAALARSSQKKRAREGYPVLFRNPGRTQSWAAGPSSLHPIKLLKWVQAGRAANGWCRCARRIAADHTGVVRAERALSALARCHRIRGRVEVQERACSRARAVRRKGREG